ncbi:hypothetical protein CYK80_12330 [Clostridium perfringens]|uniref:HNH endonuclease n=1 Tax=Clostridium perfringens TaxID=1502 RepID=A0AB37C295_CLOPF|nr:hypothetical protein [Clostridium perfringens]PWX37185.1 hypothetical protein CYK91_13585 [Clostridium perfringens]PZT51247.1 hypothetical protein CYK80_12330 [Clostridium perfringens]
MKIYHEGNRIYFSDKSVSKLGYTNFNQELWNIIKHRKFSVKYEKLKDGSKKAKYINCSSLRKTLHQIVIDFYYGEKIREEMYKDGFIIEHHDNDGFNCLIENLSFLNKKRNTSKGLGYDVERVRLLDMVAINIFKDFDTRKYQITLAFNRPYYLIGNGKKISLASMYFVYDDNYKIVINDATNILDLLESYGKLNLSKLNFKSWKYKKCIEIQMSEEEKLSPIIIRNGVFYFNMDCPFQRIERVNVNAELYKNNR